MMMATSLLLLRFLLVPVLMRGGQGGGPPRERLLPLHPHPHRTSRLGRGGPIYTAEAEYPLTF